MLDIEIDFIKDKPNLSKIKENWKSLKPTQDFLTNLDSKEEKPDKITATDLERNMTIAKCMFRIISSASVKYQSKDITLEVLQNYLFMKEKSEKSAFKNQYLQ